MPFVDTSVGRVCYEERGSGAPIVLLHATLHDRHDYDRVVEQLSRDHRTIAIDWPGHGDSDPVRDVTATRLADVLVEVLDALGVPRAVFVGNSVGGFAAARLAAQAPDRVAGLVLVNTGGFIRPTVATRFVCWLLGAPWRARLLFPSLVPAYMRARGAEDAAVTARVRGRARTPAGARVVAGLWRSFAAPSYDLRSETIDVPTLLVWGRRDRVLPMSVARQTQAALGGAGALRTFDTGHVVFASDPDGFAAAVAPFVAAVRV